MEGQKSKEVIANQETTIQDDVIVNPYTIENSTNKAIDYNKLIDKFGCFRVDEPMIARIQKLTGKPAHYFIRRGIFFAHRELDLILDAFEKHSDPDVAPFFLYTGRGPSSDALHLGHLLPFIFCKYLQEAFNVPFVIQVTDDQKFFHKEGSSLEEFTNLAYENIKDIIAVGLDPQKTFIFIDSQYMGTLYPNVCKFQRYISLNTLKGIFGLDFNNNCGQAAYPAIQAAPCLSSSFPHIFGKKDIPCLIPCGIDQDPYFRMTRDVCPKINAPKPAGFYSTFFPSLQGYNSKMSASVPNSGIFLTDSPSQIESKIKKYAFSGGRATREEQEKLGADLSVDIPFSYLQFFLEDDQKLEEIKEKYGSGRMLTGEVKKILIDVIQKVVREHEQKRSKVTMDDIKKFLSVHERKYKASSQ